MKKPRISTILIAVFFFLAVCLLAIPLFGYPYIRVTNNTGFLLTKVVLTGRGFRRKVVDIQAGESTELVVVPGGESGLEISFTVDGRQYSQDDLAYLEPTGGYCMELVVDPDRSVRVILEFNCYRLSRLLHIV